MKKEKKKTGTEGFATALCLFALTIVSVLMFSLGVSGIMNLDTQQSYRVSSLAESAARAAVAESTAQIEMDNSFGTSAKYVSAPLNNNLTGNANFSTPPCSPCPQYYSVNNLSGNSAINDGFGFPVPPGYVKINGYAAYQGKQMIYSVVATPLSYAILSQQSITAGIVNGIVRDNVASGANAIAVASAPVAVTPDSSAGAISGTVADPITGAAQTSIPTIDVASLAGSCGPPSGTTCAAKGCIDITGMSGISMTGPNCYYTASDWTMTGASGGGMTMSNGARLYILGNLSVQGGPHLDLSGGPGNNLIVVSGTITTNGNITRHSWNTSILVGGAAGQNGISTNGPSGPAITGLVYAQNGNIDLNGGSLTGNLVVQNGSAAAGNVTYDSTYMQNYKSYFTTGVPLTVMSAWQQ